MSADDSMQQLLARFADVVKPSSVEEFRSEFAPAKREILRLVHAAPASLTTKDLFPYLYHALDEARPRREFVCLIPALLNRWREGIDAYQCPFAAVAGRMLARLRAKPRLVEQRIRTLKDRLFTPMDSACPVDRPDSNSS